MILITGTELSASDLPNSDLMDYQIDNTRMNVKLKTVAKSSSCFQIYIAEAKRNDYTVTDELLQKITYFKDDNDLINLLQNGVMSNEKDIFADDAPIETPVEAPVFETPKFEPPVVEEPAPSVEEKPKKGTKSSTKATAVKEEAPKAVPLTPTVPVYEETDGPVPKMVLQEADTDIPDSLLAIPNFGDDTDALKVQLDNKDKLIAQKDGMIKELQKSIDEIYKVQEVQLREVEDMYEAKMKDTQALIESLEQRVASGNLDETAKRFVSYVNYANSYKGVVSEGFTGEDMAKMGSLTSNFFIFACGAGDSSYSMFKQIKGLMDKGSKSLIVDFSNDNFLPSAYKINSKSGNSLSLLKDDVNPVSVIKDVNGTKYIPTTSFNDIVFLAIDWPMMLKKINDLAGGKDVIMIFGNIGDFNVRSTVSKLATIGTLYVFAKSSPIILSTLYSDAQFIPKERVIIVALEYIDVVKTILNAFSSMFNIKAYVKAVAWNELKIK